MSTRTRQITRRQPSRLPLFVRGARGLTIALASLALLGLASPCALADAPTIRIAVVSTEGSPHQPRGADVLAGARAAVQAVTGRAGSRAGLRLIERTEDCTATTAETVARELSSLPDGERPHIVIGHLCASAAMAAAKIYSDAGLLMISTGARHPRLTQARASPLIFRLASRDDRLPQALAGTVLTHFSGLGVAYAHERSQQARAIIEETDALLKQQGVRAVAREAYVHGERTYAGLIDRVIASSAQLLIVPSQPIELGVMLSHLRERRSPITVIASDIVAAAVGEVTGPARDGGLIVMLPWLERPETSGLSSPTPAEAGQPSPVWLRAHAAIEAIAHAADKAPDVAPQSFVRLLETETAATLAGPIRFDTRGDVVIAAYRPWIWRGGRWHPLTP